MEQNSKTAFRSKASKHALKKLYKSTKQKKMGWTRRENVRQSTESENNLLAAP